MTVTALLRSAAIATALAGLIDPSWTARRPAPVAVEIQSAASPDADAVRRRLAAGLDGEATFDSDAEPDAVILVGGADPAGALANAGVPVSTVSLDSQAPPNVRVVSAADPDPVRAGWTSTFYAVVEARGLAGRTSRIVVEQGGAVLAQGEHRWTRDNERFDATLRYTAPASGTSTVTLRVLPAEGETTVADNVTDLRVVVSGRPLSVLVYEPRPSWNTAFIRRLLEEDPRFAVSALAQPSRGLVVRAGTPPGTLTSEALNAFDAAVIGAPEDLSPSQVEALRAFARRRGGAVVLVPDRLPSGRYLELIPSPQFDEILVENAIELRSIVGASLRASEIAAYRADAVGGHVLATLDGRGEQAKAPRPVVLEWPEGAGRVVFSGAMDAWRFRAAQDDGFARFWRARIGEGAMAAPARLEASVEPGVPRPGETMTIRARIRPTEFEQDAQGLTRLPAIRGRLIGADGEQHVIRLWPSAEQGTFEGRVEAPAAGTYDLQVSTSTGVIVDEVVSVVAGTPRPSAAVEAIDRALPLVAASTGGVAVSAGDLAPLERHLRGLSRREVARTVHPARSPFLIVLFAALLAAEWTIRRRRGRA